MPVSAATLKLLMDAGLAGDALLAVVASIDADNPPVTKERSKGAIRQERHRNKLLGVTSDVTCDVTNNVTCYVTSPSAPLDVPPLVSPTPPSEHPPFIPPPPEADASPRKTAYTEAFEAFWKLYPSRKEKPEAFKAWKVALKVAPPEQIMAGLSAYLKTREVLEGFAPYPARWLKRERWSEDFTDVQSKRGQNAKPTAIHGGFDDIDYEAGAKAFGWSSD